MPVAIPAWLVRDLYCCSSHGSIPGDVSGIKPGVKTNMKKSVLVIDDERDLCEVISRALKKEGFEVDCAFSLAEAAPKLAARPDIVILDNNLPDGSGIEYIQMHPVEFMDSFVVLVSADPGTSLQKKAIFGGIRAFLPKPFSLDLIKELLRPLQLQ
jgi:DNA-binding response OmpR family regulator